MLKAYKYLLLKTQSINQGPLKSSPTGGFNCEDNSIVLEKNVPVMNERGMIFGYGINHVEIAWNIRREPQLQASFEKLHNTPDLLAGFDSMNVQWPTRPKQKPRTPWSHQARDSATASRPQCTSGRIITLPGGPDY